MQSPTILALLWANYDASSICELAPNVRCIANHRYASPKLWISAVLFGVKSTQKIQQPSTTRLEQIVTGEKRSSSPWSSMDRMRVTTDPHFNSIHTGSISFVQPADICIANAYQTTSAPLPPTPMLVSDLDIANCIYCHRFSWNIHRSIHEWARTGKQVAS